MEYQGKYIVKAQRLIYKLLILCLVTTCSAKGQEELLSLDQILYSIMYKIKWLKKTELIALDAYSKASLSVLKTNVI